VEYELDPGQGPRERAFVAHVSFVDLDLRDDLREVLSPSRREVVQDAHPITTREERAYQGRADESRSARHQA
jgi:hypothetical protein